MNVHPHGRWRTIKKGQTRYQPLLEHLAASSETEIVLTLVEIEDILGMPLANTLYGSASSWTAPIHRHVQRWRALGWRARLDRRNRSVVFTRDTGG